MNWKNILEHVGVAALAFTPLAPIAPMVAQAIAAAEQLPRASGADKKAFVTLAVSEAVEAANAAAGHEVVNVAAATAATPVAIDTVVNAVNLVHQLQQLHPAAA